MVYVCLIMVFYMFLGKDLKQVFIIDFIECMINFILLMMDFKLFKIGLKLWNEKVLRVWIVEVDVRMKELRQRGKLMECVNYYGYGIL